MQIIFGRRGSGKTTELVKRAGVMQEIIVCLSEDRVNNIRWLSKSLGLNVEAISLSNLMRLRGTKSNVIIDDADELLSSLMRKDGFIGSITACAITSTRAMDLEKPVDNLVSIDKTELEQLREKAWRYDSLNK